MGNTTTSSLVQPNGKAKTVRKTFSRRTAVSVSIQAEPEIVWALLTKASDYPNWNSTVVGIEGEIAAGGKIQLRSKLDPKRVFKLKVKSFSPPKELVWGDAMGTRKFLVHSKGSRQVVFEMDETIGGPIFPLFAKMIPPFDASFEQFAADLKREAEKISNTH